MMNLAAKKKKAKDKHRNCRNTDSKSMAGALFKIGARKSQFNNNRNANSMDTERRANLARMDTVESSGSLPVVEFADIHKISEKENQQNNFFDTKNDKSTVMPIMHAGKMNGTVIQSPTKEDDSMFKFNIGGKSYQIRGEIVLTCRESSLLTILIQSNHEKRMNIVDDYLPETGEYYFERNVKIFDHIFDYFITGSLHKPNDICNERFNEELNFWKLNLNHLLAPCCSTINDLPKLKNINEEEKEFDGVKLEHFRKKIWRLMEDPSSSIFSKFFSFFSISFIFASVIGLILGSMPEFQQDPSMAQYYHLIYQRKPKIQHVNFDEDENFNLNWTNFKYKPTDTPNNQLILLEYICITWFTVEYILRFIVSPRKTKFITHSMNLIDLFTILPFYVEICLSVFGINADQLKDLTDEQQQEYHTFSRTTHVWIGAMLVIRVLRVLRMARVFKLARYSQGLQLFGNTLLASVTELSMLSMFLITGTVFFSTVMYFLEKDEPHSEFYSIPAACWWCIISITTVGFGDIVPVTTGGKFVAAITSICGIIILAFPISMIVEKFACAQQQALVQDQMKRAQMSAVANDFLLNRFPSRRKPQKQSTK